ncbi:MAG: hypothetical protein CO167_14075 [Candidatus Marinimicrobia bacterium CG_4_9_14_3_um_filter_48_9]|nr:MAG: hypothetical protein CO167_14075 [Candidatus Marinimicrobia bacterium CG_4_9_14_3_um_filter_48_9]
MPNITPHLWYDKNTALQAAKFYVSVFGGDSAGGGLLSFPKTVNSLLLGPGERADLIVNFSSLLLDLNCSLKARHFQQEQLRVHRVSKL